MAAISPKPSLVKTPLAKGQTNSQRLQALMPTTITQFSPITVYTPAGSPGGQLSAPSTALPNVAGWYGTFVAPDLNNGQPYPVQVECIAGGGGGGGGINNAGGGGGGGGGYSCEPNYTLSPGVAYTYLCGLPGAGGANNSSLFTQGTNGGDTIFDIAGLVMPGGVHAYGGQSGDIGSPGIGGPGGQASTNTLSYAGGTGGTNASGFGSDNPINLAKTSGMFHNNTKNSNIIQSWNIFNDGPDSTFKFNDSSTYSKPATVVTSSSGIQILKNNAPNQVPAYFTSANPPNYPNPTEAGCTALWNGAVNTRYGGYSQCQEFAFQGTQLTISCWIQCDPTGTWGNNAAGSIATVCANSKNYGTFNAFVGYGMFLKNTGTVSAPNWVLYVNWGNNTTANFVSHSLPPVVGTWYYVVATFSSGTITLYVNGTSVSTASAGFSSLAAGAYNTRVGTDAADTTNYYFGYISNLWFATDAATSSLPTLAFGSTSPTGGAGGGSSASPGGAGNPGITSSGATGGSGGVPPAIPTSLSGFTTAGGTGVAGANAAVGGTTAASGQPGAGGGGSGDMAASPALFTMVVPFATAAAYCGPDAIGGNAGTLYNANQQITSGQQSAGALFAGGQASDPATGSKNSMLLVPAGLAKTLNNGKWTIKQVAITFTNAFQTSTAETILELSYSADTVLPATYLGASVVEYIGSALIPAGADTVTYDLTLSGIGAKLQNGQATAILLGPTNNPTFDAYNSATATDFYCSIYGVGATDSGGNQLQPFLTIILQETATTQQGTPGGGGVINITDVNQGTPVAILQPFATSDSQGNQLAAGYTGNTAAFNPSLAAPNAAPDTWHTMGGVTTGAGSTLGTGWTVQSGQPLQFILDSNGLVWLNGVLNIASGGAEGTLTLFTLPAAWRPNRTCYVPMTFHPNNTTNWNNDTYLSIGTNGIATAGFAISTNITAVIFDGYYPLVSNNSSA